MSSAIWWIRRDMRLADNPALQAALSQAERVIPLCVVEPNLMRHPASKRQAFLFHGLRQLDADLRQLGSRLILRSGNPLYVLKQVMEESGAQAVFASQDYSPFAQRRECDVEANLPFKSLPGVTLRHPDAILNSSGKPYTVFTPYKKAWRALPLPKPAGLLPAPGTLVSPGEIASQLIPEEEVHPEFPAGEGEAQRRLEIFCRGAIYRYAEDRNRLDIPGTSSLSPYLRFGMLSPRQALAAAGEALYAADGKGQLGVQAWMDELIWREFFNSILYHYPGVLLMAFKPALRFIEWRDAPEDLSAWQAGLTGYPLVDAAMRQLEQTGWMHNRTRMVAASFLVKDLLLDWREGEKWFMQNLVDGDPALNNGGWQWTAGTGADAAPYFRIFNPTLQSQKFDPHGHFIRRWLPELADVPDRWIHTPWKMPEAAQREAGCQIGRTYPEPVVNRQEVRVRALEAFRQSQNTPLGEESPGGELV